MQYDLDTLYEWSKKWLLTFNPGKCVNRIISLSKDAGTHLGGDCGHEAEVPNHISGKVNKANQLWGAIMKAFKHMNPDIFKKLFCAYIIPHLKYAVQFWSSYPRNFINHYNQIVCTETSNK